MAFQRLRVAAFMQQPLLHHQPPLSPFPYLYSKALLNIGHCIADELLYGFFCLSLTIFMLLSLALCHFLNPLTLVLKNTLAKMLGSQLLKTIQEWAHLLGKGLSYLPTLMSIIYTTICYILTTAIPNAACECYNPFLLELGLIKESPKPVETNTNDPKPTALTPKRSIHESDELTILTNDLTNFFACPRVDIIRYRAPFTTLSPEKIGRVHHDYAKPNVFSIDYELAQAEEHTKEHMEQGKTAEDRDEEAYYRGKPTMTYSPDTHLAAKGTPKTANMAKAIQARHDLKGRPIKDLAILNQRDLRSRQILFTYSTGCFLLTKHSILKNVVYSLEGEETEKKDEDMELCFVDMEGNAENSVKKGVENSPEKGVENSPENRLKNSVQNGMDTAMTGDILTDDLPFTAFDDVFDTQHQKPVKEKKDKQANKAKKEEKKLKKQQQQQQLSQNEASNKQPAKDNGKKGPKKLVKAPAQPVLTQAERDALEDDALDEDLSSNVYKPNTTAVSNGNGELPDAPTAPILSQADIDDRDDEFLNDDPVPNISKPIGNVDDSSQGELPKEPTPPTLSQDDIDDADDDFINEDSVPEGLKPGAVVADADSMEMDQRGPVVEPTQATSTVSSYPAGPMEDVMDGDRLSIQVPTETESPDDDAMEQAPTGDANAPSRDGDVVMQDSDTESIHSNTPSLMRDSASEDDDVDDDEADASFITHFPTPDVVEDALDLCNDNVETMSNASDDSLFIDLSVIFSHLSLAADKFIPHPEAFRVTKASSRQAGMSPHSFFKTRVDKKDQQKVEHEKSPRPLKAKAPEKKTSSSKKDKSLTKMPRTPTSPKKASYLASALRTISPKSKLQKAKEKALLDLATKSDKKPQTPNVNMETIHVKAMDLAGSIY